MKLGPMRYDVSVAGYVLIFCSCGGIVFENTPIWVLSGLSVGALIAAYKIYRFKKQQKLNM
jgi:hypothetical protein